MDYETGDVDSQIREADASSLDDLNELLDRIATINGRVPVSALATVDVGRIRRAINALQTLQSYRAARIVTAQREGDQS